MGSGPLSLLLILRPEQTIKHNRAELLPKDGCPRKQDCSEVFDSGNLGARSWVARDEMLTQCLDETTNAAMDVLTPEYEYTRQ